jgi:hypothetical protein
VPAPEFRPGDASTGNDAEAPVRFRERLSDACFAASPSAGVAEEADTVTVADGHGAGTASIGVALALLLGHDWGQPRPGDRQTRRRRVL